MSLIMLHFRLWWLGGRLCYIRVATSVYRPPTVISGVLLLLCGHQLCWVLQPYCLLENREPLQFLDPVAYTGKQEPLKPLRLKVKTQKSNKTKIYWQAKNTSPNKLQHHTIIRPKYNHLYTEFHTYFIITYRRST